MTFKWLFLQLVFCASVGLGITPPPETRRIVNGLRAQENQFKPMVALMKGHNNVIHLICGATIISKNAILTAAHCVVCNKNAAQGDYYVLTGSTDLHQATPLKVAEFKCADQGHDIALGRMAEEFPDMTPISTIGDDDDNITSCQVVGWGAEESRRLLVTCFLCNLRYTTVDVVPIEKCIELLDDVDSSLGIRNDGTQFCTYKDGTDSCQGDSGGPVFCQMKQYGVISWGVGCAVKDRPAVSVWLPFYKSWIKKILKRWDFRK